MPTLISWWIWEHSTKSSTGWSVVAETLNVPRYWSCRRWVLWHRMRHAVIATRRRCIGSWDLGRANSWRLAMRIHRMLLLGGRGHPCSLTIHGHVASASTKSEWMCTYNKSSERKLQISSMREMQNTKKHKLKALKEQSFSPRIFIHRRVSRLRVWHSHLRSWRSARLLRRSWTATLLRMKRRSLSTRRWHPWRIVRMARLKSRSAVNRWVIPSYLPSVVHICNVTTK